MRMAVPGGGAARVSRWCVPVTPCRAGTSENGRFMFPLRLLVEFLRAVPAPALGPVAIVLLGIGDGMKVFVIFLACSFPILINTIDGVRGVDPVLIRTARTFGCSGPAILAKVVLPAASPFIVTGLRIALAIALILVVISEMVGATSGIGYYILESQRVFKVPRMYAGVLVLALLELALTSCFLFFAYWLV